MIDINKLRDAIDMGIVKQDMGAARIAMLQKELRGAIKQIEDKKILQDKQGLILLELIEHYVRCYLFLEMILLKVLYRKHQWEYGQKYFKKNLKQKYAMLHLWQEQVFIASTDVQLRAAAKQQVVKKTSMLM